MLERAQSKKKLERLIISGGRFGNRKKQDTQGMSTEDVRRALEDDVGISQMDQSDATNTSMGISDEELNALLNTEPGEAVAPGKGYEIVKDVAVSLMGSLNA